MLKKTCIFLSIVLLCFPLVLGDLGLLIDQGVANDVPPPMPEVPSNTQSQQSLDQQIPAGQDITAMVAFATQASAQDQSPPQVGFAPSTEIPSNIPIVQAEEVDSIIESQDRRIEVGIKESPSLSWWKRLWLSIVGFFRVAFGLISFTGNVIALPQYPEDPRSPPFTDITGNAIVSIPNWAANGFAGKVLLDAEYTPIAAGTQHFDLSFKVNLTQPSDNAILYKTGYFLNETSQKWERITFRGTQIGMTSWLRHAGTASVTIPTFDKDYSVFLAYGCLKKDSQWDCNGGKWGMYVLETGNVSYNQNVGEIPALGYEEIQDLNMSDIPSLLAQLGISALTFEPEIYDVVAVSPFPTHDASVGQTVDLEFTVANIGNTDLTDIRYDLDIGEESIADVLAVSAPKSLARGQRASGFVTLRLKEQGIFGFPLYVHAHNEEVDTSDNVMRFLVRSGDPIIPIRTDSLTLDWNREISYVAKEPYQEEVYADTTMSVMSGTDRVRTIFGGTFEGAPLNPTMKVGISPLVSEEALFSNPFISTIKVNSKMLNGDREPVNFFIAITNQKTGRVYTTPQMESMFAYYYTPSDLIPDFEFCTDYTSEVVLLNGTKETIDIIQPSPFNLCSFEQVMAPFQTYLLKKVDQDYIMVTGGFEPKYFGETEVIYQVEFTDPRSPNTKYYTPFVNSSQDYGMFPLRSVIPRGIDMYNGENFPGRIVNMSFHRKSGAVPREISVSSTEATIQWNGWNVQKSLSVVLKMKDTKIPIRSYGAYVYSSGSSRWNTNMESTYYIQFPRRGKDIVIMSSGSLVIDDERIFSPDGEITYIFNEAEIEYGPDLIAKILNETTFKVTIQDLTNNTLFYENEFTPDEMRQKLYPWMPAVNATYYHSFTYMNMWTLDKLKPLPGFSSGHYYDIAMTAVSDNADLYAPQVPTRFLYLDLFQFLANNPLVRTRFLNVDNHPSSMHVSVDQRSNLTNIYLSYMPRNVKLDQLSGKAVFFDTSKREIKVSELFEDELAGGSFKYHHNKPRAPKLPVSGLSIQITPLANQDYAAKKTQFNCKLGRFEGMCQRSTSSYNFNYIDTANDMMYSISFGMRDDHQFLRRYRAEPQVYDAILYDILSEINRNPVSLELSTYIPKPQNSNYGPPTYFVAPVKEFATFKQIGTHCPSMNDALRNNQVPKPGNYDLQIGSIPWFSWWSAYPDEYSENSYNYIKDDALPFQMRLSVKEWNTGNPIASKDFGKSSTQLSIDFEELSLNATKFARNITATGEYLLQIASSLSSAGPAYTNFANNATKLGNQYIAFGSNLSTHAQKWASIGSQLSSGRTFAETGFDPAAVLDEMNGLYQASYRHGSESYNLLYSVYDAVNVVGWSPIAWEGFYISLNTASNFYVFGNVIGTQQYRILGRHWADVGKDHAQIQNWFATLDLEEGKKYVIEVDDITGKRGNRPMNYPLPFVQRDNYYDDLLNRYGLALKKIESLHSTLLGPYDYAYYINCKNDSMPSQVFNWKWTSDNNIGDGESYQDFSVYGPHPKTSRVNADFVAYFSINPQVSSTYPGLEMTREELINNTIGERRFSVMSDKIYRFDMKKHEDIYTFYSIAPRAYNTFNTTLKDISCYSWRTSNDWQANYYKIPLKAQLTLKCGWSNEHELTTYNVYLAQLFPDKTANDLYALPASELQSFKEDMETVLGEYLQRYPATPLQNQALY